MDERRQRGIDAYASHFGLDPADLPSWFVMRFSVSRSLSSRVHFFGVDRQG